MNRIESARIGAVLLLFAIAMAAVVIIGSNSMATHNPILDRIIMQENSKESVLRIQPESDCGFDFEAGDFLLSGAMTSK